MVLKQEIEKIKEERVSEKLKADSEKGSMFRKGLVDTLKAAPAVIMGIVSIIATISKLKAA